MILDWDSSQEGLAEYPENKKKTSLLNGKGCKTGAVGRSHVIIDKLLTTKKKKDKNNSEQNLHEETLDTIYILYIYTSTKCSEIFISVTPEMLVKKLRTIFRFGKSTTSAQSFSLKT